MAIRTANPDRVKGALVAVVVQALLGYALVTGLAMRFPREAVEGLKMFSVAPPVPPPPVNKTVPPPAPSARPDGAPAPPNLHSQATEIVAPVPVIRFLQPSPVVAALKPALGAEATSGAAEVRGPGTGSGGIGDGFGGGGDGGYGDGGRDETPPRWRRGQLKDSDYPASLGELGTGGRVSVKYLVGVSGRITQCLITGSSGNAILDETTCRLIRERFRFEPSRDGKGRPVPAWIVESHDWVIEPVAEPALPVPAARGAR